MNSKFEELYEDVQELKALMKGVLETIENAHQEAPIEVSPEFKELPDVVVPQYVPVDTEDLQRNELDEFMLRLGYFWESNGYTSYGLYQRFDRLSFNTALKLYAVDNWEQKGTTFSPTGALSHFSFPANAIRAAFFGKGFKKLKLHWKKKTKEWLCHSNKLECMYIEYEQLLIAPLKKVKK